MEVVTDTVRYFCYLNPILKTAMIMSYGRENEDIIFYIRRKDKSNFTKK